MKNSVAWGLGIALVVFAGFAHEADGQPKRSREAILADYRAHADDYYANRRVEAFKLADEGDTSKLAELRHADCIGHAPRPGTYEEELCALYDAYFIPKGAPAGVDASTILGALHTTEPFPESSFRVTYARQLSACMGDGCLSVWTDYCGRRRDALDADVQKCVGVECAMIAIGAAQVERACTQPIPELVAEVHRTCPGCALESYPGIAGVTLFVSRVARARLTATATDIAQCRATATNTVRCADPAKASASFDEYRAHIAKASSTLAPVLSKFFPEADQALREELIALDAQAAAVAQRCTPSAATGALQAPNDFYALNGCNALNLPAATFKDLQVAYEGAWGQYVEQEAEKARAAQSARALQRDSADQAARDRAEAFRRLSEAKLASRECKVARARGQYCDTSDRLGAVESAIAHQRRVDAASGTVDAPTRRRLAESKLLLRDQLAGNAKALAGFGVRASRSQCKPATVRSQAVQDACILAAPVDQP